MLPCRSFFFLRSPDRKPGFADINRETSRIKAFRLSDAIVYSYWKDMRFVLALCAMIGFSSIKIELSLCMALTRLGLITRQFRNY
jgi:hypothetical protein